VPPVALTSVPLVWLDRSGAERLVTDGERHLYGMPHLSGDGHTAVIQIAEPDSDIWAINLDRGTRSRVTSSGFSRYPIPSSDSSRVAYASYKDGRNGLFVAGMDGGGETRLTSTTFAHFPTAWTPDNRGVIFDNNERGRFEVWTIRADGQEPGKPLMSGSFDVRDARLSPDGRWIAFVSNESGRDQVYVREFTGTARVQVSTGGGVAPVWSFNGKELFFRNGDQLLGAALTFAGSVSASQPQLILARAGLAETPGFAVAHDGKSFLMPQPVVKTVAAARSIHMVVNWFEELKRLVPSN
jgi:serine/threonine-protein kinase